MKTDAEILAFKKKTANRAEVDAYYYLDAFCDKLNQVEQNIEKRAKLIPGGWSKLRTIHGMLNSFLREIGGTFEPEKISQMQRVGKTVRVELRFNRQAAREEDLILVSADELATIITFAQQYCKLRMCEAHECRRCELGKTLDDLSWLSRGDLAWWELFGKLAREEEEKSAAD